MVGVAAGGTTVVDEGALADVVAVRVFSPQRRVFVAPVQLAVAANAVDVAADVAAGVVVAAAGTVAADVTEAARGKSEIDLREFEIFVEILQSSRKFG